MKVKQILNRFYVHEMDKAVEFYEKLLNEKCRLRVPYPQANLEVS